MDDKYNEAGLPIMENVGQGRARPTSECIYPNCEECDKYHGHYCTVPMVVSKQIWLLTEALLVRMEKRLTELEATVTEEILRSDNTRVVRLNDKLNYTWADYFEEEDQ